MKTLFFSFLSILLFTFSANTNCKIPISDMPFIENMVDPINGNFSYASIDFKIKSKEPIYIKRFYSSGDSCLQYDGGWNFFPELELKVEKYKKDKHIISIYVKESDGLKVSYQYLNTISHDWVYEPKTLKSHYGYRNTLRGELSGRKNPEKNKIKLVMNSKKIKYA